MLQWLLLLDGGDPAFRSGVERVAGHPREPQPGVGTQLLLGEPRDLAYRGADVHDVARLAAGHQIDDRGNLLDERPVALLALDQRGLLALLLGDVEDDALPQRWVPVEARDRHTMVAKPHDAPVLASEAVLPFERLLLLHGREPHATDLLQVLGSIFRWYKPPAPWAVVSSSTLNPVSSSTWGARKTDSGCTELVFTYTTAGTCSTSVR